MKRFFFLLMALFSMSILTSFISLNDKKDKSLDTLWEEYELAMMNDRIRKASDILEVIKEKAEQQRSTWDFYYAWEKYLICCSQRDWKQFHEMSDRMDAEVRQYGEPVLVYLLDSRKMQRDELIAKVREAAPELKARKNADVYLGSGTIYSDIIAPTIRNDYEFVLWHLFSLNAAHNKLAKISYEMLQEEVAGLYPQAGIAEYHYLVNSVGQEGVTARMEDLAELYDDKALSLLAHQYLLREELDSASKKGESSEYFKDFRERVKGCIKSRDSYRFGEEKLIAEKCDGLDVLLNYLDEESLSADISDGKAELYLRNIDRLGVRILSDKNNAKVFETFMDNPSGNYFVPDTLRFDLPDLDDGEYTMEFISGTRKLGSKSYSKYSLSMSYRFDAEGLAVYVADYMTGRPLESVDLRISKSRTKDIETIEDFPLDGFTKLPKNIVRNAGYFSFIARDENGRLLMTKQRYIPAAGNLSASEESSEISAKVFQERRAYNPGESVKYKAVVYETLPDGSVRTVGKGTKVKAVLRNPKGSVLVSEALRTNEFGSVAGAFDLNTVELNGMHILEIRDTKEDLLGISRFVVDEYVLPTFEVRFDAPEKIFYEADEVTVSGKVISFAGNPLSSAKVEAVVKLADKIVYEDILQPSSDGTFCISFKDRIDLDLDYRSYEVEVKVTDLTGETLSFDYRQPIMTKPDIEAELLNPATGIVNLCEGGQGDARVLSDDCAAVWCTARYRYGLTECGGLPMEYSLHKGDDTLQEGKVAAGDTLNISFADLDTGLYKFVLSYKDTRTEFRLLRIREDDRSICAEVESVFHKLREDKVKLQFGAGCGPVWAAVELFDNKGRLLESEVVHLDKGEVRVLDYGDVSGNGVRMNILYFRNGRCYRYTDTWSRPAPSLELPLSFASFQDLTTPGTEYSLSIRTESDAEVLVSVYDLATDKICPNIWGNVRPGPKSICTVPMSVINGGDGYIGFTGMGRETPFLNFAWTQSDDMMFEEGIVVTAYGSAKGRKAVKSLEGSVAGVSSDDMVAEAMSVVREEMPVVREDFSTSLAFEPFLRPDDDGLVNVGFKTSDKLSTYVVSVFAHDKDMNNSIVRKDMVVTLPVFVSLVQPQYLYAGDEYVLNASVAGNSPDDFKGVLKLDVFGGSNHNSEVSLMKKAVEVEIPSGETVSASYQMSIPSGVDTLGFRLVFSGEGQSSGSDVVDGIFVTVPVYSAEQVIQEAHSAVLLDGMSAEDVVQELQGRFVNGSYAGAEYSEISVLDMLENALPLVTEASGNDVVSLSEAMYANLLAAGLRAGAGEPVDEYLQAAMSMLPGILACADSEGGFAWFEGMNASPVVTAVVLGRFADIRDRGLFRIVAAELGEEPMNAYYDAVDDAVCYLDANYFNDSGRPLWCGRLSLWQYLNVRSRFTGIPFDKEAARKAVGAKEYREFENLVRDYLIPSRDDMWTRGDILSKVRMLTILDALSESNQGLSLAKAWGLPGTSRKLRKSMKRELESLKEYAVEHSGGGIYYPNAVLPWRGLLESELYAHSMICDLLRALSSDDEIGDGLSEIADGISLWIMLQKETQQWSSDAAFIEAMASVYDASDQVKAAKVLVMKKRFLKPFEDVEATGNGFEVSVSYYRDGVELSEGDILHLGDRIVARYSLWSEENRSFVRLSVPRPACLRPENQLSGMQGGFVRPLRQWAYRISPYMYREVKTDRTLYWIDVFPEENTLIEETLLVTQEGRFISPVAEIESLYAPHYRANDASSGYLEAGKQD